MKIASLQQELQQNSYPGRGIVLGLDETGKKAVAAYFADANLALDALEVAPDRLKPLRELTAELQGRRK